jgi:hypothetical protein
MGNTESVPSTPTAPKTDVGKTCHDAVAKSLSRDQEYTSHIELFTQAVVHREHLSDRVTVGWEYFVENKLWDIKFPTLLAFEESFAHTTALKRIVENSSRTRRRTNEEVQKLERRWGPLAELPLQPLLPQEGISYHLSRSLSKLAESVPLNDAIGPLRQAVDDRHNGPRIPGKELPHITHRDVEKVLQQTMRTATVPSSQYGAVEVPVCALISANAY